LNIIIKGLSLGSDALEVHLGADKVQGSKRKIPLILLALLWLAVTTGAGYLFWQTLSGSGSGTITVAELQKSRGVVSFRGSNAILWQSTQGRQKFHVGDVISTNGSSTATIETVDGHIIELDNNTMIRLDLDTLRRTAANGEYELRLLKGSVVARSGQGGPARAGSKKLFIATGDKVLALSDKPDAIIGVKAGAAKAEPEVFLSLGKNTLQSSGKPEAAEIPTLKKTGEGASLTGSPVPVSPDKAAPKSLALPVKPKFDLPNVGISPEMLAKLSGAANPPAPTAPVSLPKIGVPVVKKSVKFTPLKKLDSQKLETKMPPVVVPQYPLPVVQLPKRSMIVTTQKLKDGCGLASLTVHSIVVPVANTAPDWVPLLRIAFEGNGYREVADVPLPSESGKHATSVATDKICGIVGGKSSIGTITLTPGYQKEDGKIMLRRSAEKTVSVFSLFERSSPMSISFLPIANSSLKGGGWMPLVRGKSGATLTRLYVTPDVSRAVLDKAIGNAILTDISPVKAPIAGDGLFFVKNNEIVLGVTGAGKAAIDGRKMTKKLRAAFAFTGEASNFVNLNGPPINRLAKLETLTQQLESVTLIVRQRSFDMKSTDMKIGQGELLQMAASLSGAFKKKPGQIIFPQKIIAH
jgi:hypothetical protein